MSKKSLLLPLLFVFFTSLAYVSSAEEQLITMEDLLQLKKIGDYTVSPNGKYLIVSISNWVKKENKSYSILRQISLETMESIDINSPDSSSPQFINNDLLVFSQKGQLKYISFPYSSSTEVKSLTNYPVSINSYIIRNNKLAFTAEVFPIFKNDLQQTKNRIDSEKKLKKSFFVYETLMVRHWNVWYKGTLNQIFTQKLNVNTEEKSIELIGEPINRTNGDMIYIPLPPLGGSDMFDLSKNGDQLVFTALAKDNKEHLNTNWITYITDVSNEVSVNYKVLSYTQKARTTSPKFFPSLNKVLFLSMSEPFVESDNFSIKIVDLNSGDVTGGYNFDRNIESFYFYDDYHIFISYIDMGIRKLAHVDLTNPKRQVFPLNHNSIDSLSGSVIRIGSTNKVLILKNDLREMVDLFYFNFNPSTNIINNFFRLTDLNDYENLRRRTSKYDYLIINNEGLHGFLIYPFNYKYNPSVKYPIILNIHGGPESSWTNEFRASFVNSQILAKDKFVLILNPHGSVGNGREYTYSVRNNWGGKPFEDLLEGLHYVRDNYQIDYTRKCAMGGSYGGYMVNWMRGQVGSKNEYFNCYFTDDGVFNTHYTTYTTDELWFNLAEFCPPSQLNKCKPYLKEFENGFEFYSPERYIANWDKAPHLVVHGQNDFRLTWSEGNALFTTLQLLKIKSKYLFFYKEGHSVVNNNNRIKWGQVVNDFIEENIKIDKSN